MKEIPKKWKGPNWREPLNQLNNVLEQFELSFTREQRRRDLIRAIDFEIQKATLSADKVYDLILNNGLNEINADFGHILKIEDNQLKVVANRGIEKIDLVVPIDGSLAGRALREGTILNIGDVTKLPSNEYLQCHRDTKSELAIPIKDYRKVKYLGVLNVERKTEGEFDDESVSFCELLCGQVAIAMEHLKVWEGVGLINELSSKLLSGKSDLSELFQHTLNRLLKLLDFDLGQILLLEGDKLMIVASSSENDLGIIVGAEDSVCGHYILVEKGKKALIINDIKKSPYKKYYKWLLGKSEKREMRSEFVVPLLSNKRVIGVINIEDPRPSAFSEFDEHILSILGNMIAQSIESGKHQKAIQDMRNARGAALTLTQLGHLSLGFLHDFGGKIGNAKARLAEFKRTVSNLDLPDFNGMSGIEFLEGILQHLRESENVIKSFHAKFDPKIVDTSVKRIDLIKIIQEAILTAQKYKPEKISINFNCMIERSNIECFLTEQFKEVMVNIINNAIEAMPNGGKIEIKIDFEDPLTVRIIIQDDGTGMTEDIKSKMFDYAFTTKSENRQGQGLGLWYVKMYVEAFSGKIRCDSAPGKGTTFYLSFPIAIHDESVQRIL